MRTPKWLAGLGIGALMLMAALLAEPLLGLAQGNQTTPPPEADAASSSLGNPTLNPAIGLIEAQELALDGQGDAVVRSVELERENDALVWSVDLDNGVEVEIDGSTGEVLQTEQDDDDDGDDDDGDDA